MFIFKNHHIFTFVISIFIIIFIIGCSKEEITQPIEDKLIIGDYFPVSNNYQWTYSTNAIKIGGTEIDEFEMRIDTASYNTGAFLALLERLKNTEQWGSVFAIKDSNNIIYSLGDNPPELLYPLFKHQYYESEVKKETIVAGGNTYQTLKYNLIIDNDTLSFWFSDGVGLIKEYSKKGYSLFSDNNAGKDIEIRTELINYVQ